MSVEMFDPTTSSRQEPIQFAPRPATLAGLKVGLVENTKFNSKVLLEKVAERLQAKHQMTMVLLNSKLSPSHGVDDSAIKEFKTKADFVIAGIGD